MSEVNGTGDPDLDVAAVQQAVDLGGTVVLKGRFSFEGASLPGPIGNRVILVTNPVVVRGDGATILGGGNSGQGGRQSVFLVSAPNAAVRIEGIRFELPHNVAVRAVRAGDLMVKGCEVDDLLPSLVGSHNAAIGIHVLTGPFETIDIRENTIRAGGTADDTTAGIVIVASATNVRIEKNKIQDTTAHGIDLHDIGGTVEIEKNVIATGKVGRSGQPGEFVHALRAVQGGRYRIRSNELDCGFRNGAVVRLGGTTNAEVAQNLIVCSVADSEQPGEQNAGVQVRGTARGNQIFENRIRGHGRVAISVIHSDFGLDKPTDTDGNPVANSFRANNHQRFVSELTVEVGEGAIDTVITGGSGIIDDMGTGTVIQGNFQPLPA